MRDTIAQATEWWVCYADIANERASLTRDQWITDRAAWFGRFADNESFEHSQWPQCEFMPNLGPSGSLVFISTDDGKLARLDLATRAFSEYAATFSFATPESGRAASAPLARRGAVTARIGDSFYCGSFGDGVNALYRFDWAGDGTLIGPATLASCPAPFTLSGFSWDGSHAEMVQLDGKLYVFKADSWDLVTNEKDWTGAVYRYDPDFDQWETLHDSWAYRLTTLTPTPVPVTKSPHNFTVTEIPRLGVFLMAEQTQDFVTAAWLFAPPL
jgi:hypothetical protein